MAIIAGFLRMCPGKCIAGQVVIKLFFIEAKDLEI